MDNTVQSQTDLERYLPFLGVLPTIHRDDGTRQNPNISSADYRRDLHVHFYPRSSPAECMRTIRTNLMFMAPGRALQTIVVTSPSPLEGKTTTATSLAVVFSQSNLRTIIIDLDLRRPRLHKGFGMSISLGSADVLNGTHTLDDVILPTLVPNLDILGCGTIPPNPSELLHTPRFSQLLSDLRQRYDRVIIDSPPIIAVTDALIISQSCDGLILVCRSQSTRKDLLQRAAQLLHGVNAPVLGAILNNVNLLNRRQGGYYYYYYRHYGQYYEQQDDQDVA
jgi:succinoglycan biosynthesis transport protein ExoP